MYVTNYEIVNIISCLKIMIAKIVYMLIYTKTRLGLTYIIGKILFIVHDHLHHVCV